VVGCPMPEGVAEPVISLSDIDRFRDGNASCQLDGRACCDCLAYPPIGKIWPH